MERVILIAPSEYDPGLPGTPLPHQLEEIAEVLRAFFAPVPLLGRVTDRQVSDALRLGAVGVWFTGHAVSPAPGRGGGFVLSNVILPAYKLGRWMARGRVEWSYLNTCDSGAFVEELQEAWPHEVFANIVENVSDQEASENGRLFAQALADTGNLRMAYRWVTQGGPSILRRFPSPVEGTKPVLARRSGNGQATKELAQLARDIDHRAATEHNRIYLLLVILVFIQVLATGLLYREAQVVQANQRLILDNQRELLSLAREVERRVIWESRVP